MRGIYHLSEGDIFGRERIMFGREELLSGENIVLGEAEAETQVIKP